MGGILAPLSAKYLVESNKESGIGRYDHVLIPKTNNQMNVAFILEYKKYRKKESLEKQVESGLKQIEEKFYDTQIRKDPRIKKIVKICLVFQKKRATFKYKEEVI
jgi:hypothetical protein